MSIVFTQYIRPNGKKAEVEISRSLPIEQMAQEVIAKGYRFECEDLNNGTCSLTVVGPNEDDGDVAIMICRIGPPVLVAVDELVKKAYKVACGSIEEGIKRRKSGGTRSS